ncbi:hypothetical protein HPP92_001714 [Vanilla planifolia]|uniref:Uncharacterized protein n=1 Tax=Vanilla planifolia TaxID=51239 RepID=A0A835RUH4_VANPL|nr:hypothetical protein HPP92_001714 [Vanilla planifolia]
MRRSASYKPSRRICISRFKDCPLCGADIDEIEPDNDLQATVDRYIDGHARIKRFQHDADSVETENDKKNIIYEDISMERGSFLVQQAMRAFQGKNIESAKSRLSICVEDIREQLQNQGNTPELCSQLGAVLGMLGDCWGFGCTCEAIKEKSNVSSQIIDLAVSLAKVADVDRSLGNEDVAIKGFKEAVEHLESLKLNSTEAALEQRESRRCRIRAPSYEHEASVIYKSTPFGKDRLGDISSNRTAAKWTLRSSGQPRERHVTMEKRFNQEARFVVGVPFVSLVLFLERERGSLKRGVGREFSMDPSEPHWRVNSSFSPPSSRRWDCRYPSDGLSLETSGVPLYGSSQSSHSKGSRSGMSSDLFANHQHSVSDGALSYLESPSSNLQAPRWTPPVQRYYLGEFSTPVGGSRLVSSVSPLDNEVTSPVAMS